MTPNGPVTIVFGHPDGMLPNPWYRAYKRIKRGMSRSAYHVSVELRPLTRIPASTEVLVVDPAVDVGRLPPIGEVVRAEAEAVQAAIDELVERLLASGRMTVAPPSSRRTAVHVGFQPVGGRARPGE